jgi:hypothetical protein
MAHSAFQLQWVTAGVEQRLNKHPGEIHKDAHVRMVALLETAIREEHGIMAFIP